MKQPPRQHHRSAPVLSATNWRSEFKFRADTALVRSFKLSHALHAIRALRAEDG